MEEEGNEMKDTRIDVIESRFRHLISELRDIQSTSAEVEHRGVAIAITHVETAELWFKTSIVRSEEDQTGSQ